MNTFNNLVANILSESNILDDELKSKFNTLNVFTQYDYVIDGMPYNEALEKELRAMRLPYSCLPQFADFLRECIKERKDKPQYNSKTGELISTLETANATREHLKRLIKYLETVSPSEGKRNKILDAADI